jgi:hypothetical protein
MVNTTASANSILDRLENFVARISATKSVKGSSLPKNGYC